MSLKHKLANLIYVFLLLVISQQAWAIKQSNAAYPQEKFKARIEYKLEYDQEIPLRVTRVPTEYGMLQKDLDGKVKPLGAGEYVIFENTEDIKVCESLTDTEEACKEKVLIPQGSSFIGKIVQAELAKHFNRDGYVQLEVEQIIVEGENINLSAGTLGADNIEARESFKNKASKVGKTAALTLGGALVAPFIAYKIAGLLAFSNPYVTGGIAAVGASAGLAYGIYSKGKNFNLEPGSELKIKLNNDWLISQLEDEHLAEAIMLMRDESKFKKNSNSIETKIQKAFTDELLEAGYQELVTHNIKQPVELKINKVKKSGSEFGKKCMKVNLDYQNNSKESLRYLSFRLVDSMNKDYFPESKSIRAGELSELPRQGNLDLFYCVDFIKAIHSLEVRGMESYQLLAEERLFI